MLTKLKKTVLISTLAASALAGASAQAEYLTRNDMLSVMNSHATAAITRAPGIFLPVALDLECAVAGTPVEFPNDIQIWSEDGVIAGTEVAWSVPGFSGTAVLPALAPNQAAFLSNVLPGGVPAGMDCDVSEI